MSIPLLAFLFTDLKLDRFVVIVAWLLSVIVGCKLIFWYVARDERRR